METRLGDFKFTQNSRKEWEYKIDRTQAVKGVTYSAPKYKQKSRFKVQSEVSVSLMRSFDSMLGSLVRDINSDLENVF